MRTDRNVVLPSPNPSKVPSKSSGALQKLENQLKPVGTDQVCQLGLKLKEEVISSKVEHKHLGVILDSMLNFKSHIREAILKARSGIGLLKYLSKYASREVLDQTYMLYVRPHLDYGDIIYHNYDPDIQLNFMHQLEQTQYKAALAVSGVCTPTCGWVQVGKNCLKSSDGKHFITEGSAKDYVISFH